MRFRRQIKDAEVAARRQGARAAQMCRGATAEETGGDGERVLWYLRSSPGTRGECRATRVHRGARETQRGGLLL